MSQEQIDRTHLAVGLFLVIPAFRFSVELLEAMLAPGQAARALMVFSRAAAVLVMIAILPRVGLTEVLLVDMVVTGLCVVLMWFGIKRNLLALHSPGANGDLPLREMARFAGHMALVGPMSATASPGAVRLVLANTLGLAESGLFAFLQSLERLVSRYLPATLLRNLVRPVLISRFVGQGSSDLLQAGTGLLLKSNMLAVIGGLVVIAVCGDQIVMILSGGKFPNAGLTLLLLYVNMVATSQRGVQEMVMQITGHTRALWITSIVSPLALLMVWLFGGHGLNVAVLIITAGSITANSLAAGVLQVKTDWFRVDWRGMTAIFLPGLVGAALGIVLIGWFAPLIAGAIALLLFVMFLRIGRPFKSANSVRWSEWSASERRGCCAGLRADGYAATKDPGPAPDQRRVLRRRGARAGPAGIAIGSHGFDVEFACLKEASSPRSGRPAMRPLHAMPMRSRVDLALCNRLSRLVRSRQIRLLHTHTPPHGPAREAWSRLSRACRWCTTSIVRPNGTPRAACGISATASPKNSACAPRRRLIAVSASLRAASSRARRSCSAYSPGVERRARQRSRTTQLWAGRSADARNGCIVSPAQRRRGPARSDGAPAGRQRPGTPPRGRAVRIASNTSERSPRWPTRAGCEEP